MKRAGLTLIALMGAAVTGGAQAVSFADTREYRAYQIERLTADRDLLLAMIVAMPAEHFRTPLGDGAHGGGHDFGMQLSGLVRRFNAALERVFSVPGAVLSTEGTTIETPQDLAGNLRAVYDRATQLVRDQASEDRLRTVRYAGVDLPGWRFWDVQHDETVWSASQLVSYFLQHGLPYPTPRF